VKNTLMMVLFAVVLMACGGGGGGDDGDSDGAPPTSSGEGVADPEGAILYYTDGSTLWNAEPGTDEQVALVEGLTDAYRVWAIGDGIWVAQVDGRLVQTDPVAGGIISDVATGLSVIDLAYDGESLWALIGVQGLETQVVQIDPAASSILATVTAPEGNYFIDVAAGAEGVWVIGGDPLTVSAISRIDTATGALAGTYDTGMGPDSIATGFGSVWVVGSRYLNVDGSGTPGMDLVRIDPASGAEVARIDVSTFDGFPELVTGYDAVWLTDTGAGELVRVDPATNQIAARVPVGQGGADIFEIDLSKGLVWVGNPFEGRIYAVDSSDNTSGQGIEGGLSEGVAFAP
jgi:streptogramin lyase